MKKWPDDPVSQTMPNIDATSKGFVTGWSLGRPNKGDEPGLINDKSSNKGNMHGVIIITNYRWSTSWVLSQAVKIAITADVWNFLHLNNRANDMSMWPCVWQPTPKTADVTVTKIAGYVRVHILMNRWFFFVFLAFIVFTLRPLCWICH